MLVAIVVAYESQATIRECVEAAIKSGVDRVVVWDNSPTNRVAQVLAPLVGGDIVVYADGVNAGFGGGVNRAYRAATLAPEDTVLLLNPDCIVNRLAVQSMQSLLDAGAGIVAPRMEYADGRAGISGGSKPRLIKELLAMTRLDDLLPEGLRHRAVSLVTGPRNGFSYVDSLRGGEPIELDWVSGFCAMLRSKTFADTNGFDESFFLYFEDVDLCGRITGRGLSCMLDRRSRVLHYESLSTSLTGKSRNYRRGMWRYFAENGSRGERVIANLFGGKL